MITAAIENRLGLGMGVGDTLKVYDPTFLISSVMANV
jgi:hypothetical protein